jgi:LysM repeat protein
MALELVRDLIRIDQVIGEEMTQAVVAGDVVVPDSKPDVDKILSVNGWVVITDKEAVEDKVIVEGVVNVKSLYISHEGEQSLYHLEGSYGFTQQIDLPGITSKMDAEVRAEIEHIDASLVSSRKLNVKCVLNLTGKVTERSEVDVIRDIKGVRDIQVLRDHLEVSNMAGENESRVTVRQEFEIPADKPAIREILSTDVTIGERDSDVSENRISVNGILKITTLYIGSDDISSINSVKYQMPFSHYIEIAGALPGMKEKVNYLVEDFYSTVKEDEEGLNRVIEYEVMVKAEGRVETVQPVEILVDAYSPSVNLETAKANIRFKRILDSISDEIAIKEEIDLPAGSPYIEEICDIKASPVVTDFGVYEDQAVIEGVLSIRALYLTRDYEEAVHLYQDEVPFRHNVQLPGEGHTMDLDVDLYLEDLQHRVLDADLFEVRGRVRANIGISSSFEKEILLDVEETDQPGSRAQSSIVVYFIQPDDNLWKIAKRFNTTIEELVRINNIEDPENLAVGDKVIISRIVKYNLS